MKILLVEDDRSTREILKEYICDESQGRHCESAKTLAEAIHMVTVTRYDLILLDLLLDGEMSTPLIKYVRRLYYNDPPIICILSAMNGAGEIATQNDIANCIIKPFNLETIDEIILQKEMFLN